MRLNKNQVMEINLRSLLFHLLYRWRSILIAAMIGAIVLCGYQYLSLKNIHDAGKLTAEERQHQLELQEYKENIESARNTLETNTKLLQDQKTYQNESIYIRMDPQSVWTASNRYLVKIDQAVLAQQPQGSTLDLADGVLPAYSSPLSEATDEELREAFNTEKPEYIGELVTTGSSITENTITVTVKAPTKETAQKGLALLHSKMEALAAGKAQEIEAHKLSLVSEEITLKVDETLSDKQEQMIKSIKENQDALQEARQTLDKLEASGEPAAPGPHLIRMAVFGFVIGLVLLVFIYIIQYAARGRLHSAKDLAERYGLPIFGEIAASGQIHDNKGLDRVFAKWEIGKDVPEKETVYDNIAALNAEKTETKNILLVSTQPADKLKDVQDALTERVPEKTIRTQGDMTRNSEAIKEAAKADAVILVEAKEVSGIKEIDRMAENLIISEAKVIGAIIL